MRRTIAVALLTVPLLLAQVAPSEAGGRRWHRPHIRTFVGIGVGAWYPFWYYPPPYYYYPYYPPPYYAYTPPPAVVQEPPAYVKPEPAPSTAQGYWHYCTSAKAYYPDVQTCPEAWIKVPPRAQ